MAKFTLEQRMKAVIDITEHHMSHTTVARMMGCNHEVVRRWLKRYEQFGVEGLVLKHGTYTGEFKQHVVEYMHKNRLSIFETAVVFGVPSTSTVGKWVNTYDEEGPQALYRDNRGRKKTMSADKQKKDKMNKEKVNTENSEDLIAEIERLRMENAYLKKLNALVQERIARENGKK
jgi:transposase